MQLRGTGPRRGWSTWLCRPMHQVSITRIHGILLQERSSMQHVGLDVYICRGVDACSSSGRYPGAVAAVADILAQSEKMGCLQFVNAVDGQTCGVTYALCWAPCNTRQCIQGNAHSESVTEVHNSIVSKIWYKKMC